MLKHVSYDVDSEQFRLQLIILFHFFLHDILRRWLGHVILESCGSVLESPNVGIQLSNLGMILVQVLCIPSTSGTVFLPCYCYALLLFLFNGVDKYEAV